MEITQRKREKVKGSNPRTQIPKNMMELAAKRYSKKSKTREMDFTEN